MSQPNTQRLDTLAEIRPGHTFRRTDDGEEGDYRVLRISDTRAAPEELPPLVRWEGKKSPPLIADDDLLIPGRGTRFDTVWFNSERIEATRNGARGIIPSNQVYTIRTRPESRATSVVPGYLAWFLNRETSKDYFAANLRGTGIPILSREALGSLMVPVPPIDVQERIVELEQLWQEEQRLLEESNQNRRRMLDGIYQHYLSDRKHK